MIALALVAASLAPLPGCGDNGSSSSSCSGLLYAAPGRGGTPGDLYTIDPTDGTATTVGPVGFPVGAMAFGPGCTLWAVTSSNDPAINGRLLTIDTATGQGTFVALLLDAGATPYRSIAGIAFRGSVLYGWVADGSQSGGPNNELVTIDTSTGLVTPIGPGNVFTGSWEGNGIAFAPNDTLYGSSYDGDNMLLTIDRTTGIATKVANFTQNSTTDGSVKAFTFIDEVLFAIEQNRSGGASLVTIDLVTAVTTPIGLLPDVSALAYAP
jgi:hypothetical protein